MFFFYFMACMLGCLIPRILAEYEMNLASPPLDLELIEYALRAEGCRDYVVAYNDWFLHREKHLGSMWDYCTENVNCPEYILARCPNKKNEYVLKVFWDIVPSGVIFLPIEFKLFANFPLTYTESGEIRTFWKYDPKDTTHKVNKGLDTINSMEQCFIDSFTDCDFFEDIIQNDKQFSRFRMFRKYDVYFLSVFDIHGYGQVVFNATIHNPQFEPFWAMKFKLYTSLDVRSPFLGGPNEEV